MLIYVLKRHASGNNLIVPDSSEPDAADVVVETVEL